MDRRHFVLTGAGAFALSGCAGKLDSFATLAEAKQRVLDLGFGEPVLQHEGGWTLPQLLQHLAQSVEYSMQGYPEMKSAVFRATAGNLAFAFFNARGAMSHDLAAPIPGAPALTKEASLKESMRRLLEALAAFEAWSGPLKPHFAYGELDKAQYTRAHLMHLANHWVQIKSSSGR